MSAKATELRVALLGQGFMGKAHSNAFAQVGRFFETPYKLRMQVLCGRDSEKLSANASAWGWEETASDWRAVVDRSDIDIIDIALPNHMHSDVAIASLKAGKIVFCEKPLANTAEQAKEMVFAAQGLRTMVWFNYRRVPAIAYANELIQAGHIGQVFHYRGTYQQQWGPDKSRPLTWKMDPEKAGHGVIGDLLSHSVDIALLLNGDIEELSALSHIFLQGRHVEDAVLSLLRFKNGSVGSLEATRYGIGHLNGNAFEVQGEKGMLRFDLEDMNRLEFFDATASTPLQGIRRIMVTDQMHPYGREFWRPGHVIGYEHTFIAALGDFLGALEKDVPFHPDFNDGLRVQGILDTVVRSANSKRWESITA
jgi:predicted dehydrogenase